MPVRSCAASILLPPVSTHAFALIFHTNVAQPPFAMSVMGVAYGVEMFVADAEIVIVFPDAFWTNSCVPSILVAFVEMAVPVSVVGPVLDEMTAMHVADEMVDAAEVMPESVSTHANVLAAIGPDAPAATLGASDGTPADCPNAETGMARMTTMSTIGFSMTRPK